MAASDLENRVSELQREYGVLFLTVATPSLEFNRGLSNFYVLSRNLVDAAKAVPKEKSVSRELRELRRKTDVLLLLAHLKWGDYNLALAHRCYTEDRYKAESETFELEEHHRDVITALTDTAKTNYVLAERLFFSLSKSVPQIVKTRDGEVSVLKYRGDSLKNRANYLTLAQIQERKSYREELYHDVRSGKDIHTKFGDWTKTIGADFMELKPYVKKRR